LNKKQQLLLRGEGLEIATTVKIIWTEICAEIGSSPPFLYISTNFISLLTSLFLLIILLFFNEESEVKRQLII
jgi:hypothetical protein